MFHEGSRKLLKSQRKPNKVFFFLLILLGHTHSLSVGWFWFLLNSSVDGETLRTTIRISLTIIMLDQICYTINRKGFIL